MQVNRNENNVVVDCDQTLVMHNIEDYGKYVPINISYYGTSNSVVPHYTNIALLKSYKARGFHVTVWSNNGWAWAEQVVKALGLEVYVDAVQTKPCKHIDDKSDVESIVGLRVYIPSIEHQ